MRLILPLPPLNNRAYRNFRGRMVKSAEARNYQALVKASLKAEPLTGPVWVHLSVYRKRRAGDVDAFHKVLLDALNGVAWVDDKQIVHLEIDRYEDKENPRVELQIEPAEEMFIQ
jgi:crossover junction endodeoxyribonuclease RusA